MTVKPRPAALRRGVLLAALLAVAGLAASACSASSGNKSAPTVTVTNTSTPPQSSSAPHSSTPPASPSTDPNAKSVGMTSLEADGSTWGVAMPIILDFKIAPTSSVDFVKNTHVTVNGQPANGAWFWLKRTSDGPAIEAHYRPQQFWPAHATIHATFPPAGTSAGKGLKFDGELSSLTFQTGAANIGRVDGATKRMIVTSDGVEKFNFPVSLGKAKTPTYSGTKVVMEKDRVERMIGTPDDPYDLEVPWSVRITMSGEFIHAASWNTGNIGIRSTSNGCTNLTVADAEAYFNFAQLGDPVIYTNVDGPKMQDWDGYGDWNVPWSQWTLGGALSNP